MVLTVHVFRKLSLDGRISLYVGERDFTDYLSHVDPIDGILVIEPSEIGPNENVYVQVVLTYRYGREEDEVMGLTFAKEIIVSSSQIYPNLNDSSKVEELTPLQERLIRKLGKKATPFVMQLPREGPPSVTLQPGQDDQGRPCGVQWELRAFVGESDHCLKEKKSCVRMGIRRQQFTPATQNCQPVATCTKDFLLSAGKMHLHVTLDKQIYYHGEPIAIHLKISNQSHKQVKKMKVSILQLCDVSLGVTGQLRHYLCVIESQDGCPILSNVTLEKTFTLTPSLEDNKEKRGLAIHANYYPQEPCLASSTLCTSSNPQEVFGVSVSYVARVKVCMGPLAGDLTTEVPFTLMSPSPITPPPPLIVPQLNVEPADRKEEEEVPQWVVQEGQGPVFSDTEPDTEGCQTTQAGDQKPEKKSYRPKSPFKKDAFLISFSKKERFKIKL